MLFSLSVVSDSATPWTTACQASLSFTVSQSLLQLMSIELVMPPNRLTLCRPLLLLPSIFPIYESSPFIYPHMNKCVHLHLYLYLYDNVKWFFKPKTEMSLAIRSAESSLWEKLVCLSSVRVGCSQVAHDLDVTNQMKKWRLFCQFGVVIS